ncbi:hypothetical protein [Candidatus Psyllophila symbiotica]
MYNALRRISNGSFLLLVMFPIPKIPTKKSILLEINNNDDNNNFFLILLFKKFFFFFI